MVPLTNPIRRRVDLMNQALFLGVFTVGAEEGGLMASKWSSLMKSVVKVQRESQLLHFMEQQVASLGGEGSEGGVEVSGVVYRVDTEPGTGFNRVFVYLEIGQNGLFTSFKEAVTSEAAEKSGLEKEIPCKARFRLFYFKYDYDLKKKVRVSRLRKTT